MNNMTSKEIYDTLTNNALKHPLLYHYTSLDSLGIILANQSLMLSCLPNVNDPEEDKRITSLWKSKVFVSCFTNTLENSDYFFENYGEVRITFINDFKNIDVFFDTMLHNRLLNFHKDFNSRSNRFHKFYLKTEDWCLFDISIADVYYAEKLDDFIGIDGYELNAGLIKSKKGKDNLERSREWYIEQETRVRVAVRPIGVERDRKGIFFECPKPPFDHLFCSIKGKIVNIEINDNCSDDKREYFQKLTSKYFQ